MSSQAWVDARLPTQGVHLDVAAAGRVSEAVLTAQVDHLRAEAQRGAYVAEAAAEPAVLRGRDALGALVGLRASDVFFTEGAASAFAVLLEAWPLPAGSRVGVVDGDYRGNSLQLAARAAARGWQLVPLPVDPLGRVSDVPAGLDLLALPHVPSQRGVVQPVEDLLATGVPLLLDVAQSLGQVPVPEGAAAYVGTSRKWLCGPRGVGFGVVSAPWQEQLRPPAALAALDQQGIRRFDSQDPHAAGRVGLALAAQTWSPALLPRIASAAAAARVLLEGVGGWHVVEPVDERTGITTMTHALADPVATRAALLAEGIVVSAVPVTRSGDLPAPVLRLSTAAWVTPADLEAVAAALERLTR